LTTQHEASHSVSISYMASNTVAVAGDLACSNSYLSVALTYASLHVFSIQDGSHIFSFEDPYGQYIQAHTIVNDTLIAGSAERYKGLGLSLKVNSVLLSNSTYMAGRLSLSAVIVALGLPQIKTFLVFIEES